MAKIAAFMDSVMALQGGSSNTFAVATLPFPPKISALPTDQRLLYSSDNKIVELIELTDSITSMNKDTAAPYMMNCAPFLHTWGMRTGKVKNSVPLQAHDQDRGVPTQQVEGDLKIPRLKI